jgi:hypothetical protein
MKVGTEALPLFQPSAPGPAVARPAPLLPWDPRRFEEPLTRAPMHRAGDPEPSITAARLALPTAREQEKQIAAALQVMGPVSADGATGGGTAEDIAFELNGKTLEGPWNNVIICRRIADMRLNDVFSYDGDPEKGNPLVQRRGRVTNRPMTVHEALPYRRQKLAAERDAAASQTTALQQVA